MRESMDEIALAEPEKFGAVIAHPFFDPQGRLID